MTAGLAVFVPLYAGLLAVWALIAAATARGPGPGLVGGLVLLELSVLAQAVLLLLAGRPAAEPVTFAAYLVTSVVLLPLLLALPGGADRDASAERRWTCAVVAVACVTLVVVNVRLVVTGPDLLTGLRTPIDPVR